MPAGTATTSAPKPAYIPAELGLGDPATRAGSLDPVTSLTGRGAVQVSLPITVNSD